MAQGLRVRLTRAAWTGFGIILCGGLIGCMNDDRRPLMNPPMAKGSNPGARPGLANTPGAGGAGMGYDRNTATGMQPGGAGAMQPMGGARPGGNAAYNNYPGANPYNTGGIGNPTVPGTVGAGGPIPGGSAVVPSVSPSVNTNYPPVSPTSYQQPSYPLNQPASSTAYHNDPPVSQLRDVPQPPPAPDFSSPGGVAPPVAPVGPLPPPGSMQE